MDNLDGQFQTLRVDRIKESMMSEITAMEEYEADLRATSEIGFVNFIQSGYRITNNVG